MAPPLQLAPLPVPPPPCAVAKSFVRMGVPPNVVTVFYGYEEANLLCLTPVIQQLRACDTPEFCKV